MTVARTTAVFEDAFVDVDNVKYDLNGEASIPIISVFADEGEDPLTIGHVYVQEPFRIEMDEDDYELRMD